MSIVEWIAVCSVIVCTAATIICGVCVAACWFLTLRVLRNRPEVSTNPPPVGGPVTSPAYDYVRPSQPWPKPRPAPAVAPVRPIEPPAETLADEDTPVCEKCGARTRGPVRAELKAGQSLLVFACECGTESKIPAT